MEKKMALVYVLEMSELKSWRHFERRRRRSFPDYSRSPCTSIHLKAI